MPPRRWVALVVVFWLATTGFVAYRDFWPRLFASGPPPIAVDLADEASQFVPGKWAVVRGDKKIGRLTTTMMHVDEDDTFEFTHRYTQLTFDFANFRILIPEAISTTRMTRDGRLREQLIDGRMALLLATRENEYGTIAEARMKVNGRVEHGLFLAHCDLDSPLFTVNRDLDPVTVPDGHALNPLQPVNRIPNVRPGQRWVVQEINPLDEAIGALFQQKLGEGGLQLPTAKRESLIAEVGSSPEPLRSNGEDVPCWVIEYRGGEARAKTWVRVTDGKVLRQEAFLRGERVALERDD